MVTKFLTLEEVAEVLRDACDTEGGIRTWAETHGVHPSVIDKFFAGQRGIAPQVLNALGLEAVTVYRQKLPTRAR